METSSAAPQTPAPDKIPLLPLWATVGKAYSIAWSYRSEYIKIICTWFVIGVPVMAIYNWFVWPYMQPALCIDYSHLPPKAEIDANAHAMMLATIPLTVARLLVAASVAVAWHRLVLRGEHVTATRYLRMDNVVMNYFTVALCIFLISMFGNAIGMISTQNPIFMIGKGLIMMVAGIGTILIAIRISTILPAKALGLPLTVGEVWEKTSWNFWRLTWGYLFCSLPVFPLFVVGLYLKEFCNSALNGSLLYTLYSLLIIVFIVPPYLSFLSLAYQHFFEREQA